MVWKLSGALGHWLLLADLLGQAVSHSSCLTRNVHVERGSARDGIERGRCVDRELDRAKRGRIYENDLSSLLALCVDPNGGSSGQRC